MLSTMLAAPLRHWGKVLCVWVLIVAAVVAVTAMTPEEFRSEGKLFVRLGRENSALDPTVTAGHGSVVALPASRDYELNSIVEVLRSRGLAEQVVAKLGVELFLDKPPAPAATSEASAEGGPSLLATVWKKVNPLQANPAQERALRNFDEHLSVEVAKKSSIINVSYEHHSPEAAQKILQTLIALYVEEHGRLNRTPGSHDFLTTQTEKLKSQLVASEEQLRELKNNAKVTAVPEQQQLLQTRASSLEDQLFEAEAGLSVAKVRVATLQKTMADLPATRVASKVDGHPNQAADLVRSELYALELREQEMLSKYTPEHFLVKQLQQQVAEARAIADKLAPDREQVTTSAHPAYDQLQVELLNAQVLQTSLAAKSAAVQGQLKDTRAEMVRLNDQTTQMARLERDVEVHEASYRQYLQSVEQTRLDEALDARQMSNVAVAQAPSLQLRAVRPRKLLNYAAGIVLATVASLSLAVLLELVSSRVRTPRHLAEELEVSALVSVPHMRTASLSAGARHPR